MALVTDPITVTGYDDELYACLPLYLTWAS
jgi:hypothetical protein